MSKIDQLTESVARMEVKIDGFLKAQEIQCRMLSQHDEILRGGGEGRSEGLCEQVRNINKRHAFIATLIPVAITAGWEYFKRKMGAH